MLKIIENLIEIYYLFLKEYMNLFISFVKRQLDGNIPEHLLLQVKQAHKGKMDLMNRIIERGIKENVIIDMDNKLLTHAIESTIKGFNLPFIEYENVHAQEKDLEIIKQIIFKGICK